VALILLLATREDLERDLLLPALALAGAGLALLAARCRAIDPGAQLILDGEHAFAFLGAGGSGGGVPGDARRHFQRLVLRPEHGFFKVSDTVQFNLMENRDLVCANLVVQHGSGAPSSGLSLRRGTPGPNECVDMTLPRSAAAPGVDAVDLWAGHRARAHGDASGWTWGAADGELATTLAVQGEVGFQGCAGALRATLNLGRGDSRLTMAGDVRRTGMRLGDSVQVWHLDRAESVGRVAVEGGRIILEGPRERWSILDPIPALAGGDYFQVPS
jgi:hypothetical protein